MIGTLHPADQDAVDETLEEDLENNDPYEHEPEGSDRRHPDLIVHSEQPMNAEVPADLLTENYITPTPLHYIRHHHPVPKFDDDTVDDFSVQIDLTAAGGGS